MKRTTVLVAAVLALLGCGTPVADPTDPRTAALDAYLSARTELGRWSGAALVAFGDRVILRKGYGYADVERRIPYRPETAQPVASISKMFTAFGALKLRDRGTLALSDSLCDHLDDCPATWRPITIDHLIHHRSGIPDYEERLELGSEAYTALMTQPGAPAKILADAKTRPLEFTPGEKFKYSNTGYIALAYALEHASGSSFAELMAKTALQPAGMSHSGMLGAGPAPPEMAAGYTYGDIGWAKILGGAALTDGHLTRVPSLAMSPPHGDGWAYSTVDDLLAYSRAMEGNAEVVAAQDGYGAGWIVDRAFDRPRLRHNGILPGFVSELVRFPEEKITIVLLSNVDRVRLSRIVRDVSAIALGQPFDMPVRGDVVKLTKEQIAPLVGTYVFEDGRTLEIRDEPDYLTAEMKGQFTAGLIPLSPTEMYVPLADGRMIFTTDSVNLRFNGADQIATRAPSP